MYLLDTNIVSETRKPRPHPQVMAWIQSVPQHELFLASVTLGELQKGVELLRPRDSALAARIDAWIGVVASASEVLPADDPVFREWARMTGGRRELKWEDALIAATARVHGLTVATRNTRDFSPFQVPVFNPFPPSEEINR